MIPLFWEIARCPHMDSALAGRGACAEVVRAQNGVGHLPEPWVGRIDRARILFVSSNPGFDPAEHFPTLEWPIGQTEEFFRDRFSAGTPPYVSDFRVRLAAGGYAERAPQYWTEAHGCAADLLDAEPDQVVPGADYALTEVVHCKSPRNVGTASAANFCAANYLRRILSASASRVVVCYGDIVWPVTQALLGVPVEALPESRVGLFGPFDVEGRERIFLFLPQPGSSRSRKPASVLEWAELNTIRRWLGGSEPRVPAAPGAMEEPTEQSRDSGEASAEIDEILREFLPDGACVAQPAREPRHNEQFRDAPMAGRSPILEEDVLAALNDQGLTANKEVEGWRGADGRVGDRYVWWPKSARGRIRCLHLGNFRANTPITEPIQNGRVRFQLEFRGADREQAIGALREAVRMLVEV